MRQKQRRESRNVRQSLARHHQYAGERGIKIAIENCPMLWKDTWPSGTNLRPPAVWQRMFEMIPDDNFGLNYDPSHLVWQSIDYIRPIHEFTDRIFHVHAKDMRVDREGLYRDGVLGCGFSWAIPQTAGTWRCRLVGVHVGALRSRL
ncbi:MAG: sugar phosphate isomerase/epimerase [Thermomicrobiales bacterium]